MKAILEFNLPDDRYDHACSIHGAAAFGVIGDVLNRIRNHLKHGDYADSEDVLQSIREDLGEIYQKVEDM